MLNIEDIALVLIRNRHETPHHWMQRWAVSYPLVQSIFIDEKNEALWTTSIEQKTQSLFNCDLFFVAHSTACQAFLLWLFNTSLIQQKNIRGAILAAPNQDTWPSNPEHPSNRVKTHFPTALVSSKDNVLCPPNWAKERAIQLSAKYIALPENQHLDTPLKGWQWGMELMQDMLLI